MEDNDNDRWFGDVSPFISATIIFCSCIRIFRLDISLIGMEEYNAQL